jgi:hypothetical protein
MHLVKSLINNYNLSSMKLLEQEKVCENVLSFNGLENVVSF